MDATPAQEPDRALPASQRQVLVLDLSRSMRAPLPDPAGPEREKIEIARSAVGRIVRHAQSSRSAFGLVSFSDAPKIVLPLGLIKRADIARIDGMIADLEPDGRSAIWDALASAAELLRSGPGPVSGTIVLVTDGWDNASRRFAPLGTTDGAPRALRSDLLGALLPPGSDLRLRIIGIGSGTQLNKGVDTAGMQKFLGGLNSRAARMGVPAGFAYEQVDTGAELYEEMVHAFIDVDDAPVRLHAELAPDELAQHAALAARALKGSGGESAIARMRSSSVEPETEVAADPDVPEMGVDVVSTSGGDATSLTEKYGALGRVVQAYLAQDYEAASASLQRARTALIPVTYSYWRAKIALGRGDAAEASQALIDSWKEVQSVPSKGRVQVVRRLALLQSRLQADPEAESLIRFVEQTESQIRSAPSELKERVLELLEGLLELRGTYDLTRADAAERGEAAQQHEQAVEELFGQMQDIRLDNTAGDPMIDGTLDFVEILLAEMR